MQPSIYPDGTQCTKVSLWWDWRIYYTAYNSSSVCVLRPMAEGEVSQRKVQMQQNEHWVTRWAKQQSWGLFHPHSQPNSHAKGPYWKTVRICVGYVREIESKGWERVKVDWTIMHLSTVAGRQRVQETTALDLIAFLDRPLKDLPTNQTMSCPQIFSKPVYYLSGCDSPLSYYSAEVSNPAPERPPSCRL